MRRTPLLIVLVFSAGLGVGYFTRGAIGTTHGTDTRSADLAAIEKLHRADVIHNAEPVPECAKGLHDTLEKVSPENESKN